MLASPKVAAQGTDSSAKAQLPPEIENPEVIGINKLPAYARMYRYR